MPLPKLPRLVLALAAAVVAATLLPASSPALAGTPKVGAKFPDLTQERLEGTLPDLKGKVVLVDFWASWCGPCKASFPALKEIHEKYAAQGFTVLAVSIDESKDDMLGFLKKNAVPFMAVRDAKGTLAEKLDIQSIPTSFLLDRSGKILLVHSGYDGDATKKEYIHAIESALKP